MHSLLSREHYFSPEVFAVERERIFRRLWILAALRPMVSRHLEFRTLEIAGIPVIVQNLNGKVRAFANVCRHRLGRIHADEFGSRPLICPYHHWSYDDFGVLKAVPKNAAMFQLSAEQMRGIRLREFQVEVVGSLIFVNLSDDPLPIGAQFGVDLLSLLASATDRMDSEFIYTRYSASFNWKAGMENIKDPLHVLCLHRESFPKHIRVEVDRQGIPSVNHDIPVPWRQVNLIDASAYQDAPIETASAHPWQALVENLDSKGFYRGIHLFPNVNLMIVDGTSFSIQIYNPLAPDCTEMQMMVALTRQLDEFDYKPVVLWEHLKSDMAVLNEDLVCLEAVQANYSAASFDVIHGAYETGIMDFHAGYLGAMARD